MLTDHEKDLLLASLKHYMTMEVRHKVMAELPIAYNHWMGQDVMFVARNNEPEDPKMVRVRSQRRWMTECGGDEAGYIEHYKAVSQNPAAIYRADAAHLAHLEHEAGLI